METIIIRNATKADIRVIQAIYAPYVTDTVITFEYDVPTVEEMERRMEQVQKKYPWLVAEENGKVVGYAYASAFKERAAYQWAVETSIYVDGQEKRKGIGRQLHDALEEALKMQGILNMNACISFPADALNNQPTRLTNPSPQEEYTPDPHLTLDSVHFHERLGYTTVAHFHLCGKKFGRWYDMIWMEKMIGEHKP